MANPAAAVNRIVAVLQGISGIQHVYTAAPESLDSRVNVYVTLDRWAVLDHTPGLVRHEVDIGVTFTYRVAGAEATTETALMGHVGAFISAMLAERRTQLNGTVVSLGLPDFTRAAEPQYAVVAGSEFRLYPGTIRCVFQETF